MKVLFIDDEYLIRKGLQAIIPWVEYGFDEFLEAESGEEGLQVIKRENPELVLLDIRMGDMDGLTLSGRARQEEFQGRIIIISGYSDFSYAKTAIDSKVTAYLLKPVDSEELKAAVQKAIEELERDSLLKIYESQTVKQVQNTLLLNLLTGRIAYHDDMEKKYHLKLRGGYLHLSAIYRNPNLDSSDRLDEFLAEENGTGYIILDENTVFWLHTDREKFRAFEKKAELFLDRGAKEALFFLTGNPFYEVKQLPKIYQEMKILTREIFYYANATHICRLQKRKEYKLEFDLLNETQELVNGMIIGDKDSVSRYMSGLEEYLFQRKNEISALGFIMGNSYQQIYDKAGKLYPHLYGLLPSNTVFAEQLSHLNYFYEYIDYMRERIQLCMDIIQEYQEERPGLKVCKYIEKNYAFPLKLEQIAEQLGYNSVYLGKLFRNEMKMSFNSYVDQVRMEKAMEWLESGMSVARTSEKVGFKDVDYFTKKFKKHVGCLPSDYRKKNS